MLKRIEEPLDEVYNLSYTVDHKNINIIAESGDANRVRGIMLDRYLHFRETLDVIEDRINLDNAEIVFEDGAGNHHLLSWKITNI